MKGFVKTIIAGAVIIGLGVAILLITLGINGWNINVALGNSNFEMKTYNAVNSVETLKVDFYAGSLEIEFYDGDEVKIEYPENKKYSAEINEENGVLSMSTGSRHWYDWFLNWSIINLPATKISLPADSKVNLDLELNAGSVDVAGGEYGDTKIHINAGSIEAGAIDCGNLSSELNAGSLDMEKAACSDLKIKMNAGTADINRIYCDNIHAKINAGAMNLEVVGSEKEYGISIKKNAGSCNKSDHHGTHPDKKITGEINAGSLDISFVD